MDFSLSFPKKSDLPWGQKYIFRNPCIASKFPPKSFMSHSSVSSRFVGSEENVPLIFLSYSSSLLPLSLPFAENPAAYS